MSLQRLIVRAGRRVYRATPSQRLRELYFRAFCRAMRDRHVRATVAGSAFDLDLGEMIDVALYLEQYEPDVTAAIERYCQPGMTVLDIGANIGAHALRLARRAGPSGVVHAFEPTEFAFAKLQRNAALNPELPLRSYRLALGERDAPDQPMQFRSSWRTSGERRNTAGRVDFVRLDGWADRHGVDRVALIKIDVDGYEFPAFAGGERLLTRSRPIILMEAVWPHFADPRTNPFALLSRLGYRFLDARTSQPFGSLDEICSHFPDQDTAMTASLNVIALPSHA